MTLSEETSDFEKLQKAFGALTSNLSSLDDLLSTFGLKDMPSAQRYGILFGCLTFCCTVAAVVTLLVLGGSFRRIRQQAETGTHTVPSAIEARAGRPLLLERLLEARTRMLRNYQTAGTEKDFTVLTRLLANDAPPKHVDPVNETDVDASAGKQSSSAKENDDGVLSDFEQNYILAYRTCQDKPGGRILSGLPEARFEAYARAYAGCGSWTTTSYRRSYARLYEKMACSTHATEKQYADRYRQRPRDVVGRTVILEPLQASRHAPALFDITRGDAFGNCKSFDPNEVWAFCDFGPFESAEELSQSWIFVRPCQTEAAFAIVQATTDHLLGVIHVVQDDPQNLNIQLEPPIVKPTCKNTVEELEACFLLMDRLFALGYRRIQLTLDSQDAASKKLPGRLGFTQEGMIPKHMIVKEANRDSLLYGMLNSDWDKGARALLFKKLHGAKHQKQDEWNNQKEEEKEVQHQVLKEQQQQQQQQQCKMQEQMEPKLVDDDDK